MDCSILDTLASFNSFQTRDACFLSTKLETVAMSSTFAPITKTLQHWVKHDKYQCIYPCDICSSAFSLISSQRIRTSRLVPPPAQRVIRSRPEGRGGLQLERFGPLFGRGAVHFWLWKRSQTLVLLRSSWQTAFLVSERALVKLYLGLKIVLKTTLHLTCCYLCKPCHCSRLIWARWQLSLWRFWLL